MASRENDPPGGDHMPDPVFQTTRGIINGIMNAGQWGNVSSSTTVPQENGMWEFRCTLRTDDTTRPHRRSGWHDK